ncbi:MAG: hypothetical protein ABEJ48_03520 [Halobacteriales archaeon]
MTIEMWVRSDAAPALAVVSAWFAALLPWNIEFVEVGPDQPVLFLRWPLWQVRYAWNVPFARGIKLDTVLSALQFQSGTSIAQAYTVWLGGAIVVLVAIGLSVGWFADEDAIYDLPIPWHPVRLMGGLLAVATALFVLSTVLLYTRGFGGIPIPIGLLVTAILATVLLVADIEPQPTADPDKA